MAMGRGWCGPGPPGNSPGPGPGAQIGTAAGGSGGLLGDRSGQRPGLRRGVCLRIRVLELLGSTVLAYRHVDAVRHSFPLRPALAFGTLSSRSSARSCGWSRCFLDRGAAWGPMGTRYSLLILAVVWFAVLPLSIFLADRLRPQKGTGQYRI